jgi:ribose transport system substrate-binding protein
MSTKAIALAITLGLAPFLGQSAHASSVGAPFAGLSGEVLSRGANGEIPVPASTLSLSDEELAKIAALNATAAIVMPSTGDLNNGAQVAGLKSQFEKMEIKVIAVTDSEWDPQKQVSQIETILARKPNIIVSVPADPAATKAMFEKARDQGVILVFISSTPLGFVGGKDYLANVSSDDYGNGVVTGDLMGKALNGKGEVGVVYRAGNVFVTQERYDAFKKTIREKYPNIKIVAEQGIDGPDFAGDAEKAASAMLASHPHLNGIWAVWDVPAEGVMAAARSAGRNDLVITTCDLGINVAIEMARDGMVKGIGAQRPYDAGVAEALVSGYGLIGKKAPTYVGLPSVAIARDTLLQSWQSVYHADAPKEVQEMFNK